MESKNMKYLALFTLVAFTGCTKDPVPVQPRTAIDAFGSTYQLVSNEVAISNGEFKVELWEKIDPPDTNRWYVPTLSSKLDTNSVPMFNPLLR